MKGNAVMEALLRPPIEMWSAAIAWGIALVALAAPWALMMPPLLGVVAAVIALWFGAVRMNEALDVIRYQRGLKFSKITRIAPHKLPVAKDELYLGEGFEWTAQHTQRKLDTQRKEVEAFVRPTPMELRFCALGARLDTWAQKNLNAPKTPAPKRLVAQAVGRLLEAGGTANPLCAHIDLGGSPVLHGVGANDERPIFLKHSERPGHQLTCGTTRVGKTRLLEQSSTQDIHAGHVTIVIDPKGDADLMMRMYAEAHRAGREKNFYLFHLGYPEISARYNGIGNFSRITEVATRATNALPSAGNSAAFKEFSWRFSNIVAQAMVALGRIPTYETLLRDVTGVEPLFMDYAHSFFRKQAATGRFTDYAERLARLEEKVINRKVPVSRSLADRRSEVVAMYLWVSANATLINDSVLNGLAAAISYDRVFYEKVIASLGPFLEKLTSGAVGKLISPDYFDTEDKRPIFDWMTVIRQKGIVYVGLDALSDSVVSSAVGNTMLADLVSVGGKLYKTGTDPHHPEGKLVLPTVCTHLDEVNEICGPEFVPMVNKLGGAGFRISAYTQSYYDIEAKVGDRAKAGQILDNFNNLVMLRVRSITTAKLMTDQVPQVNVVHLTPMSGVTDTAAQGTGVDFTSRNDDIVTTSKVPLIEPADLLELPKGQAFALLEGNRRFKLRIPLPDTRGDVFIPESIQKVAADMKRRYRTSEHWASETDWLGSSWQNHQPLGAAGTGLIDTTLAAQAMYADEAEDEARQADEGATGSVLDHGAVLGNVMGHQL